MTGGESESIVVTHPMPNWELKRSYKFRRCKDTQKPIWPFTKAYYNDVFTILNANMRRIDVIRPEIARWISPEAYTFRKLKAAK